MEKSIHPEKFDGFRFTQLCERDRVAVAGQQATSISSADYPYSSISPGRLFAANEIKAFLAHILQVVGFVTYDIKFAEGKQAPPSLAVNAMHIPRKANVIQEAPKVKCYRGSY
ncbi:hypothetical protein EI94DRAFT_1721333 [Lactarius quietus]|nr:hypothetical protein EI94DRAFT_1756359 [Lactarius quietus]KAF8271098.1 hypothetical protein EI94DRAFT_1721333 [Lactarius quietus]